MNEEYWDARIEHSNHPRQVRIDGKCYWIGDEAYGLYAGFDGVKFVIEFNDGRRVTTTNLWANGDIPLEYRDKLPDNAKFIKGEQV